MSYIAWSKRIDLHFRLPMNEACEEVHDVRPTIALFLIVICCAVIVWLEKQPIARLTPQEARRTQIDRSISIESSESDNSPTESYAGPEKLEVASLPNAFRITSSIISGGLPEGERAFQELENLRVKTIISVDGMKPDVERARKHGMKYVHLPHGYDGIPQHRGEDLAKAVTELPGPIYIHCHHGKHRSPAAATVACVTAGLIPASHADSILKTVGTGDHYRGLYQSARDARPVDAAQLRNRNVEFVEVAALPALAQSMVELEHTFDVLKRRAAVDFGALAPPFDKEDSHQALLLKEHFAEMRRLPNIAVEFQSYFENSERESHNLERSLERQPPDIERAQKSLTAIAHDCTICHRTIRDLPLTEKTK